MEEDEIIEEESIKDFKRLDLSRFKKVRVNKNLHSELHLFVDDICKYFGEPKSFGMFLGMCRRAGIGHARYCLSTVKQGNLPVREQAKRFVGMLTKKMIKTEITITEGFYRQKSDKKKFEVKIYRNSRTGELSYLVPLWVIEEPQHWIKVISG